jgi:hypothetical protein
MSQNLKAFYWLEVFSEEVLQEIGSSREFEVDTRVRDGLAYLGPFTADGEDCHHRRPVRTSLFATVWWRCFGVVDVFVINENGNAIVLELKDIRLGELLSGRHGRLINPPDYTEMEKLDKEVSSRGVQTGGFSLGFGCEVFVLKLDGKLGFGLNPPGEK